MDCAFLLKAAVVAATSIYGLIFDGDFTAEEIAIFMPAYNSSPPESDYKPDTILVFIDPKNKAARTLLMGEGTCLVNVDTIPLPIMEAMRQPGKGT